jgi:peptidoglycan/xylan/chitin deacetylase (PgdA/CDA1 family)
MYHHVNSAPPPADIYAAALTTTDADFQRQLSYLKCAGYWPITVAQLFDGIYNGGPLPQKPVLLTFDDGHADAYTNVFPVLRWHGFVGTFSIVSGYVDLPGNVTWAQVIEMSNAGMEIVAHTVSHEDLNISRDDIVRYQAVESKRALEANIGKPVNYFTYPSGEPFVRGTPERQAQVVQILRESGYHGALATRNGTLQDPGQPFALSRVRVMNGVDIVKFAENMGGPPPAAIGC